MCQRESSSPVFKVVAHHKDDDSVAKRAESREAGGLEPNLELSIGCKLMLLENFWTERGIVNGTQCWLYDIVWPAGAEVNKEDPDQPLCLLVAVLRASYNGPFVAAGHVRGQEVLIVPVYRSRREWFKSGAIRYREQFPVRLAYAITIHKAQGMTVPKVVVDLDAGVKNLALFYVAVSRVKRLEDIMFETPFDLDRVTGSHGAHGDMRQRDWEMRALQRLTAANMASTSQIARGGLSLLSQQVLSAAVLA